MLPKLDVPIYETKINFNMAKHCKISAIFS
jgi:hypothetical protein